MPVNETSGRRVLGAISRRATAAALALMSAVAVAACGSSQSTGTSADPATAVPASVPMYVGALVSPEGPLKQDTVADAKALTHMKDPFGELVKALEGVDRLGHFNYAREVKPWLGPRIGLFATSLQPSTTAAELLGKALSGGVSSKSLLEGGAEGLISGATGGAMVLDTTDLAKARSFLAHLASEQGARQAVYRGVHYQVDSHGQAEGIVGKFAVIGSQAAMRSVIDTHSGGPSLASSSSGAYAKLTAKSSSRSILSMYLSTAQAGKSAGAGTLMGLLPGEPSQAVISLVPEAHAITLDAAMLAGSPSAESTVSASTQSASKLLASLPGNSWLAAAVGQTQTHLPAYLHALSAIFPVLGGTLLHSLGGPQLESLLRSLSSKASELQSVFSGWAGAAGIFAAGSGLLNIQAGLVIESSAPGRSRAAVAKLGAALQAAGASVKPATVAGSEAAIAVNAGLPITLDIAAGGDRFVIGLGPASAESALSASGALSGSPLYKSASTTLGAAKPALILDFPNMIALLEGLGLSESEGLSSVMPYLRSLGTLAGGWQDLGGGITRLHLTLGLHGG